MAISESDYLHIHKGDSSFLLLRNSTHFHLVRIDASLSESRMMRLLRIYPCDTEQLEKMGIHFSAFKADSVRGIVIKGYQTGDILELWIGGDVREYQLGSDYSDEIISSFFSGYLIARRQPQKWEGLDPKLIHIITWSLNGIAIVCAIPFCLIRLPYKLWSVLCILCQVLSLTIPMFYPASFTLADDSRKHQLYINKGKGHLLPAYIVPAFALCLRTSSDFTFSERFFETFLLVALISSLVLCAVYIWMKKGLQNCSTNTIAVIFTIIFLGLGTLGQMNYLLDFNFKDRQVAELVDKEMTNHTKSTSYYCTVQFQNGEYMELTLPAETYRSINIGDDVIVTHHDGAFHISFSTVELYNDVS